MSYAEHIAKAITGAILAALSMLAGFLINDTSFGDITAGQWVAVAIAFLVALGAVWTIPNGPNPNEGNPPSTPLKA